MTGALSEQRAIRRAGDRGWVVDLDRTRIPTFLALVRRKPWCALVQDMVPAAQSVLFVAHSAGDMAVLETHIAAALAHTCDAAESAYISDSEDRGQTLVIHVVYDGVDLEDVANRLGLSASAVVAEHTGGQYTVGFFGFAPGFAYIDGTPETLALPRQNSPRPQVPAGAVAIAGTQTVVYPGGTPGGWHIIGHTNRRLWNAEWENPTLLQVGDQIEFVEATA